MLGSKDLEIKDTGLGFKGLSAIIQVEDIQATT